MTGSVETTLTLLLQLLLALTSLSSTRGCSTIHSRPHPQGYCGHQLVRLHRNFCFLIRSEYPEYFTMSKRSADPRPKRHLRSVMSTQNIPLSILASLDIPETQTDLETAARGVQENDNLDLEQSFDTYGSEDGDVPYKGLLHVLRKRSSRQKRNLVCDCCYGPCTAHTLAQYC